MKSLFKWALACLIISLVLAGLSVALDTRLEYSSYLSLFNILATCIFLFILASTSLSVVGLFKERMKRFRYLLLLVVNALIIVWVMLL